MRRNFKQFDLIWFNCALRGADMLAVRAKTSFSQFPSNRGLFYASF